MKLEQYKRNRKTNGQKIVQEAHYSETHKMGYTEFP